MAKLSDPPAANRDRDQAPIFTAYEGVVRGRERLAALPALTAQDLASITVAMHEAVWFFLRLPRGKAAGLALPPQVLSDLARAARDRSNDLYTTLVAALAVKLAGKPARQTALHLAEDILDGIDSVTFDFRATKSVTLERLLAVKTHLDDRIAHTKQSRRRRFRFLEPPEKYRERPNKRETPDRFLQRIYGAHLKRGLTQADIRDVDPKFYNVLHVWCARHGKRMADLVPTSRAHPR